MPPRKPAAVGKTAPKTSRGRAPSPAAQVAAALAALERKSSAHDRQNLARFGITAKKALGVSMANLRALAKPLRPNHALAEGLWRTGVYEARMLATLVDDPQEVTAAQMERWCRDFDNWAICDTACFALFDRSPHAWGKVAAWHDRSDEFQKRAAFALLACLALHGKGIGDEPFLESLPLIERGAKDERNFVKKGVSWALRAIGGRNRVLHAAASTLARRLSESPGAGSRWVGKDCLRGLGSPAVAKRLKGRT